MAVKPKHWSRQHERGSLLGMTLLLGMYGAFGKAFFKLLLLPVIGYYYLRHRSLRVASQNYLQRLQAYAAAQQQVLPYAHLSSFKHLYRFGEAMLEKIAVWRGDITVEDVIFPNEAYAQNIFNQQPNGFILGAHLGDLELCRALSRRHPHLKITALVYTKHAVRFNHLLQKNQPEDERLRFEMLQVDEFNASTAVVLQEKIQAGRWLVMVGDRTSTSHEERVLWADFLGHKAPFTPGPYVLASLLKVPVYLLFALKPKNQFYIYFEAFSDHIVLPRGQRQEALQSYAQAYADRLSHYALCSPYDWFNFYPFWNLADDNNKRPKPE